MEHGTMEMVSVLPNLYIPMFVHVGMYVPTRAHRIIPECTRIDFISNQ